MSNRLLEICGDVPLSRSDQWRYFMLGLCQIGQAMGKCVSVKQVRLDFKNDDTRFKIKEGASPLRVYTDSLMRQVVRTCLLGEGPICDIGCGNGGHSRLFKDLGETHCYLGLDIRENVGQSFSGRPGMVRCWFVRMSAGELGLASESAAFVFSSCVLEHIDHVDHAVGEIARAMRQESYGLHVVPSVWSLFLYLFHGYRRFAPNGLLELFQQANLLVEEIWALGGLPSSLFHCMWITLFETIVFGKILRFTGGMRTGKLLRLYSWLLSLSLRADALIPFAPAGYAVVIRKP